MTTRPLFPFIVGGVLVHIDPPAADDSSSMHLPDTQPLPIVTAEEPAHTAPSSTDHDYAMLLQAIANSIDNQATCIAGPFEAFVTLPARLPNAGPTLMPPLADLCAKKAGRASLGLRVYSDRTPRLRVLRAALDRLRTEPELAGCLVAAWDRCWEPDTVGPPGNAAAAVWLTRECPAGSRSPRLLSVSDAMPRQTDVYIRRAAIEALGRAQLQWRDVERVVHEGSPMHSHRVGRELAMCTRGGKMWTGPQESPRQVTGEIGVAMSVAQLVQASLGAEHGEARCVLGLVATEPGAFVVAAHTHAPRLPLRLA